MKEYCKSIKVYPIGNLTLSNTTKACMESMHNTSTPLWIGIVRDLYENKEQGMTFLVRNTFSTCQVTFWLVNFIFCLKYLFMFKRLHLFQPIGSLYVLIFSNTYFHWFEKGSNYYKLFCVHVPTSIYHTIYYTHFYNA